MGMKAREGREEAAEGQGRPEEARKAGEGRRRPGRPGKASGGQGRPEEARKAEGSVSSKPHHPASPAAGRRCVVGGQRL